MKTRRLFLVALLAMVLALVAFVPLAAQRFDWVITKKLSVLEGGALISSILNMDNNPIQNIGAAGTDFDSSGGLTTAAGVTVSDGNLTAADDFIVSQGHTNRCRARELLRRRWKRAALPPARC